MRQGVGVRMRVLVGCSAVVQVILPLEGGAPFIAEAVARGEAQRVRGPAPGEAAPGGAAARGLGLRHGGLRRREQRRLAPEGQRRGRRGRERPVACKNGRQSAARHLNARKRAGNRTLRQRGRIR